jgi:hypothetical protein
MGRHSCSSSLHRLCPSGARATLARLTGPGDLWGHPGRHRSGKIVGRHRWRAWIRHRIRAHESAIIQLFSFLVPFPS